MATTKTKTKKISFNPKSLGISDDTPVVFGVPVELEKGMLVATVDTEIADAFIDAGKAK